MAAAASTFQSQPAAGRIAKSTVANASACPFHHAWSVRPQRLARRNWCRRSSAAATAGSRKPCAPANAAAAEDRMPANQPHDPDSPVLVLAGFHLEQVATVRMVLDTVGGEAVRVVPATPALLHAPAIEALRAREPRWGEPAPRDWVPGGGWGQQRMVLMAGILGEGQQMVLDILEEAGLPGVVPALATADIYSKPLGELLADALRQHRQGRSVIAAAAAAEGEEEADPQLPVPLVEELPPLEEVLPAEVLQPAAAAPPRGASASTSGGGGGAEVLQAEFSEAAAAVAPQPAEARTAAEQPPSQPATAATAAAAAAAPSAGEAGAVPLDLIDSIAEGREARELDSLDSEELLAAARQALGLDDGRLQRLVDDAAEAAAAALNVPFVAGGQPAAEDAAVAAQDTSGADQGPAGPGGSSGAMPWNSAASQQQPAAVPPVRGSRGFAAASGTRRGGFKAKPGGEAARKAAVQAADAAARAGPAAAARRAPVPEEEGAGEGVREEGRPIPPVERFILSKAQLKAVTDQHGLDFEEILAGLASKGIQLAE